METADGGIDEAEHTRMMGPLSITEQKELIAIIKQPTDLFIASRCVRDTIRVSAGKTRPL